VLYSVTTEPCVTALADLADRTSKRRAGVRLARSPTEITLADVVRATNGARFFRGLPPGSEPL